MHGAILRVENGEGDLAWPLERIVERVRTLAPRFPPGRPGKVHDSDTNDELLGRIIETVTGKPIAEAVQECIFDELDLRDTYVFRDPPDTRPAPLYYRNAPDTCRATSRP